MTDDQAAELPATTEPVVEPKQNPLAPNLMNGHDVNNRKWQNFIDNSVRRLGYEVMTMGVVTALSSSSDPTFISDMRKKQSNARNSQNMGCFYATLDPLSFPVVWEENGDADMLVWPAYGSSVARDFCAMRIQDDHPKQRCIVKVKGLKPPHHYYFYKMTCQISRNHDMLFVEEHDYVCKPPSRVILESLMAAADMKKSMSEAVLLCLEQKGLLSPDDSRHLPPSTAILNPEDLVEVLDQLLQEQLYNSLSEKSKLVSSSSKWSIKDASPDEARDYAIFWSQPEVTRYFGGDLFRKLARYFHPAWLMGLRILNKELQTLYKLLCENPLQFCFPHAAPQLVSRKHKYYKDLFSLEHMRYKPLSLIKLINVCMRENLEVPKDTDLLDVVVYFSALDLHSSYKHMCTGVEQLHDHIIDWYASDSSSIFHIDPFELWDGDDGAFVPDKIQHLQCVQKNICGFVDPRSGNNVFDWEESFGELILYHIAMSLSRLASEHWSYSLVATSPLFDDHHKLVEHMRKGSFTKEQLDSIVVYTADVYRMEAMLLRGVDATTRLTKDNSTRIGPMNLYPLDARAMCCSEQVAGMRASIAYDINGHHGIPSGPFKIKNGAGGAGKTEELNLICQALGDPELMLLLTQMGSQLDAALSRFSWLRGETLMRFLLHHLFLCPHCSPDADSSCGLSQKQISEMREKSELMATKLKKEYDQWLEKSGGEFYSPKSGECLVYGYPYKVCPLEKVQVLVLDEFPTTSYKAFTLLVNTIHRCCPNLRVVILMGDNHQLEPIAPGDIQGDMIAGFGKMDYEHSHRNGQGPLGQLAKASRTGDIDLVRFDGKQTHFVELLSRDNEQQMVEDIKFSLAQLGLHVNNSQIITRTNNIRHLLNRELERDRYNGNSHCVGNGSFYAGQKIVFKSNMPAWGVNNNGRYFLHCVAHVFLRPASPTVPATQVQNPDKRKSKYLDEVDQRKRKWTEEAQECARLQQAELNVAGMMVGHLLDNKTEDEAEDDHEFDHLRSTINIEQVLNDIHETNGGVTSGLLPPELESNEYTDETIENIPESILEATPHLSNGKRFTELPLVSSAIDKLLDEHNQQPGDPQDGKYRVEITDAVTNTAMQIQYPPGTKRDKRLKPKYGKVLVCSKFSEFDQRPSARSIDKRKLIYIPFTKSTRHLVEPGICTTCHCMQGHQTRCIVLVLPYTTNQRDTREFIYTAVTRAIAAEGRPALVVFAPSKSDFLNAVRNRAPPRISHTGKLLRRIYEVRWDGMPAMDYTQAAYVEHVLENGGARFGKKDKSFVDMWLDQQCGDNPRLRANFTAQLEGMRDHLSQPFGSLEPPKYEKRTVDHEDDGARMGVALHQSCSNSFQGIDDDEDMDSFLSTMVLPTNLKDLKNHAPQFKSYIPNMDLIQCDL